MITHWPLYTYRLVPLLAFSSVLLEFVLCIAMVDERHEFALGRREHQLKKTKCDSASEQELQCCNYLTLGTDYCRG